MSSTISTLQVSVDDIKQNLSFYLQRVQAGETFVIIAASGPLAEIRPITSSSRFMRPIGLCAGEFSVPGDFDAPLSEQVLQEFEGL
jgi:antitoxin (DNA-binding transcriptional repressor) of toxin-antitoxin stability system